MARRSRAPANAAEQSGPAAKQAKHTDPAPPASEVAGQDVAATDDELNSVTSASAVAFVSDARLMPEEITALITRFALPPAYDVRYCEFCKSSSLSDNPFTDHVDCKAWCHQIPWGNGTREKPRGNLCRFEQVRLQS
jgi:hypothetical protein